MPKKTARKVEPCVNLCSKEMFYKDPADNDPEAEEHEKEVERLFGTCETAVYWCQCTQAGRGPDDSPVTREGCSRTRRCFVGLDSLA